MLCVSCFVRLFFLFFFFSFPKNICLNKLVHAFWLPVFSSHPISVPPNWQRHATKKVRSFIPCHFIIFGERSDPPRNLRVPDFRDLDSRPCTSRPRKLPRARIKNSQRPPPNTRDKGNLIFHSYSKTDVRAPCVDILNFVLYLASSVCFTRNLARAKKNIFCGLVSPETGLLSLWKVILLFASLLCLLNSMFWLCYVWRSGTQRFKFSRPY